MSQQNIKIASQQINASVSPVTLEALSGVGDPPDITKLILANTSASPCMVTISDGVNNYYYEVPANQTVIDNSGLSSDMASTKWIATCATSVNSMWVTAIFD